MYCHTTPLVASQARRAGSRYAPNANPKKTIVFLKLRSVESSAQETLRTPPLVENRMNDNGLGELRIDGQQQSRASNEFWQHFVTLNNSQTTNSKTVKQSNNQRQTVKQSDSQQSNSQRQTVKQSASQTANSQTANSKQSNSQTVKQSNNQTSSTTALVFKSPGRPVFWWTPSFSSGYCICLRGPQLKSCLRKSPKGER
jgi:hypothetical protein